MSRNNAHITALIDGEPVKLPKGSTVLDAAHKAGIYIPTLCYLEDLHSYGGCRLCTVKIKGRNGYPTACTTPLESGMEILTKTNDLQSLRRNILEMTLSEHPYTCLVCKDKMECKDFMHTTRKAGTITGCNFCTSNGDCELQDLIDYLDLKDVRFPISYRGIKPEKNNPFYDLDYNLCVLCGRCVRICNEERNSNVLAFVQRGNSSIVGTAFNESQADAGCEFCGACVDVCPTGSISGKLGKWSGPPDKPVETTCTLCSVGCTINVNTRGGKLVDVGPAPGMRTDPLQLCIRGKFLAGDIMQHPDRITVPMIRRNGRLVEVSWDEAMQFTAENLARYQDNNTGVIGSAQDTLEENYILQKFARQAIKTDKTHPHEGTNPQLLSPGRMDDMLKADTILILGTDASLTHPMVENRIRKAFNMGRNILYANSDRTRTSLFSTRKIYYSECSELLFLWVLLAELAKESIAGFPAGFAEQLSEPLLKRALRNCSVDEDDLKAFVTTLAKSRKLFIVAGESFLGGEPRKETIKAIQNIQYIKGEKSICSTVLLSNEGILGGNQMLSAIGKDGIKALVLAGDIPVSKKLKSLKFLVQMNMFHTELSELADVLLPTTGFLENEGHFLTVEGNIKRLRKTIHAAGKSKPITQIISGIAAAMKVDGFTNARTSAIWKEMAPGMDSPFIKKGKQSLKYQSLKPLNGAAAAKPASFSDHYRYRGNSLATLVPDLQAVIENLMSEKSSYG